MPTAMFSFVLRDHTWEIQKFKQKLYSQNYRFILTSTDLKTAVGSLSRTTETVGKKIVLKRNFLGNPIH